MVVVVVGRAVAEVEVGLVVAGVVVVGREVVVCLDAEEVFAGREVVVVAGRRLVVL